MNSSGLFTTGLQAPSIVGESVGIIVRGKGDPNNNPSVPSSCMAWIDSDSGSFWLDVSANGEAGTSRVWSRMTVANTGSVGGVLAWDGTGSKPTTAGPAWLIGTTGSAAAKQLWYKTTSRNSNADWIDY